MLIVSVTSYLNRVSDDNGHDNSINGNSFTENNADQILGSDLRSFDTSSENTRTGCENSPARQSQTVSKESNNFNC